MHMLPVSLNRTINQQMVTRTLTLILTYAIEMIHGMLVISYQQIVT